MTPRPAPTAVEIAQELNKHHPALNRQTVSSGVTCQCGYWNGDSPDYELTSRNPIKGRDGLDYHRARVLEKLLEGAA